MIERVRVQFRYDLFSMTRQIRLHFRGRVCEIAVLDVAVRTLRPELERAFEGYNVMVTDLSYLADYVHLTLLHSGVNEGEVHFELRTEKKTIWRLHHDREPIYSELDQEIQEEESRSLRDEDDDSNMRWLSRYHDLVKRQGELHRGEVRQHNPRAERQQAVQAPYHGHTAEVSAPTEGGRSYMPYTAWGARQWS